MRDYFSNDVETAACLAALEELPEERWDRPSPQELAEDAAESRRRVQRREDALESAANAERRKQES